MAKIELFLEFLFEMIGERNEPLVLGIEVIRSVFKLREYI